MFRPVRLGTPCAHLLALLAPATALSTATMAVPALAADGAGDATPNGADAATSVPAVSPNWQLPPDTLGGSWTGALTGAWAVPFGRPDTRLYQREASADGWSFGGEVAHGLSRTLALGLTFDYATHGAGRHCSDCTTDEWSAGPRLRYHLVQGARLDPWVDFGIAFRSSTVETATGTNLRWQGLDVARLRVGGEWYPIPMLGVGPYLGLDNTLFWSRPGTAAAEASANASSGSAAWRLTYTMGLRALVRFPGR